VPAMGLNLSSHRMHLSLVTRPYNFVRIHRTLRATPAMAANVTKRLLEIGDIVDVLEAWEQFAHAFQGN
jgi:hypothetical protein